MKKYYVIGVVVFCVAIIGYHFYAASEAEQQINKAIQEQAGKLDSVSVQYSVIDVAPFGGSVSIQDLTFVFGNHIERAQHLQLELSYLDFLNIYIGGVEYGLDHLSRATITFRKPSYVNQAGLEELKLDELVVTYRGNALDGLRSAINGTAFKTTQSIEAESSRLIVQLPKTTLSKITAKSFRYSGSVSADQSSFWKNGSHQVAMDSLTWTPSQTFQDAYGFFLKGFGYDTDAIPFQSAHLHTNPVQQNGLLKIESSVDSELALFSGSGYVQLRNRLGNSELKDVQLSITKFSDSFRQVLQNIERLLSVSLPRSENGITLQLSGTLSNPSVSP